MFGPMIRWSSGRGGRGRLSIFIFHRVLPAPDPLFPGEVDCEQFDRMVGWIASWFRVLPLEAAVQALRNGTLPDGAAAITFDDGYADNLHHAQPLLRKHGACATLFVATGFLGGGCMWNDRVIESVRRTWKDQLDVPQVLPEPVPLSDVRQRRAAIELLISRIKYLGPRERSGAVEQVERAAGVQMPRDLMLTHDELRGWHAGGQQVGAHTVNHPILASLQDDEARSEIAHGRDELESLLDARIALFAYPNGRPGTDYLPQHVAMARDIGFDAAVSTTWGVATPDSPAFELPRFTPWDRTQGRFAVRLLRNLATA